jgi:hypothetical protein
MQNPDILSRQLKKETAPITFWERFWARFWDNIRQQFIAVTFYFVLLYWIPVNVADALSPLIIERLGLTGYWSAFVCFFLVGIFSLIVLAAIWRSIVLLFQALRKSIMIV